MSTKTKILIAGLALAALVALSVGLLVRSNLESRRQLAAARSAQTIAEQEASERRQAHERALAEREAAVRYAEARAAATAFPSIPAAIEAAGPGLAPA